MAIDIISCYEQKQDPLDYVLPGFLYGTVGSLFSAGGSGKSMLALEATMSIACSVAGGDLLGMNPQAHGRVVYFAGEDPEIVLRHRIHDMTQQMCWQAVHAIADRLDIEPMLGVSLDLFDPEHIERVIDYAAEPRLIVFDTISRFHTRDENSNGDMAQLIKKLEQIAVRTGAAVLYLHHANKASSRDGMDTEQQASRGASALVDNVRWAALIRRMTQDESKRLSDDSFNGTPIGDDRRSFFVRFELPKNNYGPPLSTQWYQRGTGGVLTPVHLIDSE